MVRWPHGHGGGRERAPRPAVHDESGSAFGGVEGHAARSGGLCGALDKEGVQCARCQVCTGEIDAKSLKKTTVHCSVL